MEKNRVDVVIDGQIITLVSNENEAYLQKLGRYIDKKLNELRISKPNKPVTEQLRTLLISANIADDYFKVMEKQQELEKVQTGHDSQMESIKSENAMLTDKLYKLQSQLKVGREQYSREVGQLNESNTMLTNKVQALQNQLQEDLTKSEVEVIRLRNECERLTAVNSVLQEQLKHARNELEEYISTFEEARPEDNKNVVSFNSGIAR